ncbi:SPFH domain-containing protein [bacterium]|nr:MAG: SPFH domain-containing protein [bacterium]
MSILMEILEWFDETGEEMVLRLPPEGSTDIKFGAQLIVRDSQRAIFYVGGQARDEFDSGRFTLSTKNLPLITRALSLPWGFESPFRCEVYFVNKKLFTSLKWGTREPVAFRDRELGLVRLRAHGQISFRINDGEKFISEMVGTRGSFSTWDATDYLRDVIVSRLNDYLGENLDTVFDLPAIYDETGEALVEKLNPDFGKYGLALDDFFITSITPPDEVQQMIDAKAGMKLAGDMATYMQYQAARSLGNGDGQGGGSSTAGGMVEAGAGLGIGMMLPQMMSRQSSQSAGTATAEIFCTACGRGMVTEDRFCGGCGEPVRGEDESGQDKSGDDQEN